MEQSLALQYPPSTDPTVSNGSFKVQATTTQENKRWGRRGGGGGVGKERKGERGRGREGKKEEEKGVQ